MPKNVKDPADHVFVGRQPIYDARLRVIGYELLYRSDSGNRADARDNAATCQTIFNAFIEIGLNRLVGDKPAFINLTRELLSEMHGFSPPTGRVVLEVLEDVTVDESLVQAVRDLKGRGYRIALDDFVYQPKHKSLLRLADIVKIEVLGKPRSEIREEVMFLRRRVPKLLAEKVETHSDFQYCKNLGFDYFQGFFFCKPKVLKARAVPADKLALLQLLSKLRDPNVRLEELEQIIMRDVALSYKLLRCINSAFYGLPKKIDSLRQAILFLGMRSILGWVSLVALSGITGKPSELFVTAMVRAKMCELLARDTRKKQPEVYFTTGLLSVLDALMDMPMENLLESLPLSDEVNKVLLGRDEDSDLADLLRCVLAYERGDWDRVAESGIEGKTVQHAYVEAVDWAAQTSDALRSAGRRPRAKRQVA
ncbi:MAG: HDOD domain-containing protein [Armatimonadetes bacterium]|nr:HDOD domain-containing protein [Armatimonadota bacterium]